MSNNQATTSDVTIIEHLNFSEEETEVSSLASAFVYTSGLSKIGKPGIVIFVGPSIGEPPVSVSVIEERLKFANWAIHSLVNFDLKAPRLEQANGRIYVGNSCQQSLECIQKIMSLIGGNKEHDFVNQGIVYVPSYTSSPVAFKYYADHIH